MGLREAGPEPDGGFAGCHCFGEAAAASEQEAEAGMRLRKPAVEGDRRAQMMFASGEPVEIEVRIAER
jgi:hypothetical protein